MNLNKIFYLIAFVLVLLFFAVYFLYSNWRTGDSEEDQNTPETNSSIRDYDFEKMFPNDTMADPYFHDLNGDGNEEAIIEMADGFQGTRLLIINLINSYPIILFDQVLGYATDIKLANNDITFFTPNRVANENKPASEWTFTDKHKIFWNVNKYVLERTK